MLQWMTANALCGVTRRKKGKKGPPVIHHEISGEDRLRQHEEKERAKAEDRARIQQGKEDRKAKKAAKDADKARRQAEKAERDANKPKKICMPRNRKSSSGTKVRMLS